MPIKLDGINSARVSHHEMATEFDISLSLWENKGLIEGTFEYNVDILKRDTIIRLRENFISLVNVLLDNMNIPVDKLSIITNEEKSLIDSFNQTKTDYPKDKTIVQLFEEQVVKNPDKPAIKFENNVLTYNQLNIKSNQLAHTLLKFGVQTNEPIGILEQVDLI